MKQLIELAVACGRKMQSKQTGYIHYCYHNDEDDNHHPIPVLENLLFALALMRTRTSENVLEGKALVEKLLPFQQQGNFPIYIHDFPQCKDRFLAIHLLAPLYWILKHFQQVIGQETKSKLEKTATDLVNYSLALHQEKTVPYALGVKLAGGAKAFGQLFNQPTWEKEGEGMLQHYMEQSNETAWYIPKSISDILIGLQMAYPSISQSPWKHFWEHLCNTWYQETCSYAGPAVHQYQEGFEPQATLYDLFLGYFWEKFSTRALVDRPGLLFGALIQETDDRIPYQEYPMTYEGRIKDQSWQVQQNEYYSCALLEKKEPINPAVENAFHPLQLQWGNSQFAHTFVYQGGNAAKINYTPFPGEGFDLVFTLGESILVEDREKQREVTFFFDVQDETKITIGGVPATTFQLGDKVRIQTKDLEISMEFRIEEGEGHFFGHMMRGNRPSQLSLKGINRFKAYDWQVFLRTVRRSANCRVRAMIRVKNV